MHRDRKAQLGVIVFVVLAVIIGVLTNLRTTPPRSRITSGTFEFVTLGTLFYGYNLFIFRDKIDSSYLLVLSEKFSPTADSAACRDGEIPSRGSDYTLTIERVDNTRDLLPQQFITLSGGAPFQYRVGDILIWNVDSLALPAYFSPNVCNKYIITKEETRNLGG